MHPSFNITPPATARTALRNAIATLAVATALFIAILISTLSPAHAGDEARFLRLGLNKSAVIRLPVEAKDVLIGNPEVVDAVVRTRTTAYLFAKTNGQTNIFFFDKEGRQILNLEIEVAADVRALKQLLDRTLPDNQITIDTVRNNIILRGVAKSSGEAKQAMDLAEMFVTTTGQSGSAQKGAGVVSALTIAARDQVMLRVRVAEVQREVLKQLGVDYNTAFATGNFVAGMYTGNPMTLNGTLASSDLATGIPLNPLSGLGGANGAPVSRFAYGDAIDGVVRAMERDGLLRTLAEPTLTAISGESAKFLAGGEFPVITGIDADTGARTVEFKEFGVGLGFSPVVLSEGRISLKINTEVSEPDGSTALAGITGLKSRKAETTVELPSGGSMIMAGMIQEDTRQAINGLPGAKNLPILGQLFRSNDFKQSQTELTVMVTPYIVKPVNERELVSPIDKLSVATDRQSYLFGRINKVYGTPGGTTKGGANYHGNVGFIVE